MIQITIRVIRYGRTEGQTDLKSRKAFKFFSLKKVHNEYDSGVPYRGGTFLCKTRMLTRTKAMFIKYEASINTI